MPGLTMLNLDLIGLGSLLVLLYMFLGIAIVADLFVEAIEVITS